MIDQARSNEARKAYCKPEIERVRLVPGEAVLTICKTASAGGGSGLVGSGNCTLAEPAPCLDQTGS